MLWIVMVSVERVKFDLNVKYTALVFEGLRFRSHLDDHISNTLKSLFNIYSTFATLYDLCCRELSLANNLHNEITFSANTFTYIYIYICFSLSLKGHVFSTSKNLNLLSQENVFWHVCLKLPRWFAYQYFLSIIVNAIRYFAFFSLKRVWSFTTWKNLKIP